MRMTPVRAIVYGGLTVGALDLADAMIFFYLRSGVSPVAILHSIAAGLLGPAAARAGGGATAALGLAVHFLIATIIVAIYVAASRRWSFLRRRVVLCGLIYGVIAYFIMNYVVVPLSNARSGGPIVWPIVTNGLLIHALGVGLPAAWFAAGVEHRGTSTGDEHREIREIRDVTQ
jgi:hypothetical protein